MYHNVWGVPPPPGLEDQQYAVFMQMASGNWPTLPTSVDWHYARDGSGTIVWRMSADQRHYVYGVLTDATSQVMQTMHRHSEDFWEACQLLITDDVVLDQVDGARRRTMSQELCADIYYAIEEQVIKWNAQQLVANSLSDSSRR